MTKKPEEKLLESQRDKFGWKKGDLQPAELSQCADCQNNSSPTGCLAFITKPPELWDNMTPCPMKIQKKVSK